MVKVTVAMAAYNHEKFVETTIESVLTQTDCDFDFVIVDDGSSDKTAEKIRKFKDSRIHFIPFEKNQGACTALNRAVQEGKGEYVAILNSDDCFLPGKLKKQTDFLDTHPDISAVFAYPQFIDEKGQLLDENNDWRKIFIQPNRKRHEWLNYLFFHHNVLCHPTVLIRRSCYETLGYYEPRLSKLPDFDFWVRVLLKYEIHVMPEELIQFRILANNGNSSAPKLETIYRHDWEFPHVLKHYLTIPSIEEYLTIFPKEADHVTKKDPEFIPFYLSLLALRTKSQSYYSFFALETLYSLFGNPNLKTKLESYFDYTLTDFFKNPTLPIFHLPPSPLPSSPPAPDPFFNQLKKYFSPKRIGKKVYNTLSQLF